MSKAIKIIVTALVVGGAAVYLLVSSFGGESMVYYKTVDELLAERARFEARPVRVNGMLVDGSVARKPGTDEYRFTITKNGKQIEVTYRGILPETMLPGREIIVEGSLQPGGDVFAGSDILTKCPSKYESVAKSKGGK
jgi:cytochrome c-type biogenesis protein CcmE